MADAARSGPMQDDADLALDARGTRFVDHETERRYEAWSVERGSRAIQASLRAAILIWLGALVLVLAMTPVGAAPWVVAIGGVLAAATLPLYVLRTKRTAWLSTTLLASVTLSGLVAIGLARVHLDSPGAAMAAAVWACFFQFRTGAVRARPLALAIAPTFLTELLGLARDVSAGALEPSVAALGAFLVASAYAIGLLGAIRSAASKRRSFRQSRIIERQAATIAADRERREAELARELRHQVAERSRELGAVLARSDVSLDVRRLVPGERFAERYRIVSLLGAGGMGVVYEVERVTDGQRLALKAVVGEVSGASAARFAREAEIGARVHHAHLVSILDVGVSGGVPFLVMELVRGGSLEARRERFGDVAWALPILRQIALGVAALHDAGVVHRDLKPANVLISGEASAPFAKISDFGISRFGAIDESASIDPNAATLGAAPSPRSGALTGTGVVLGTPLYMAPEAARGGRTLDAAADAFALGVLGYELLGGRAPFAVPAPMLVMAGQPIPTAAALDVTGVPAELAALLRACLDEDPTRRPRVRELLDTLAPSSA